MLERRCAPRERNFVVVADSAFGILGRGNSGWRETVDDAGLQGASLQDQAIRACACVAASMYGGYENYI